ncbi:hypothetical protein A3Q56_02756 [Intoshia linei]|uniref:DUF4371 domain-containing protein n=1 Tax=Intoshia linei TaxID=1819745 RepID=A0A177B5D2_9BILA|nr:hypothetical protein A3Q56_02756 [Intoshia linei]
MLLNQNDLEIRNEKIFCLRCKNVYPIHKGTLKRHVLTALHSNAPNVLPVLDTDQSSSIVKTLKIEICMAIYSACHTSILSIEHFTKLLNTFKISNTPVRLGRTKCSQLIKNVISPVFFKEIVTTLKDQPLSLIVDESTDILCEKYLCVVMSRIIKIEYNNMAFDFENVFKDFDDVDSGYDCY